MKTKLSIGLAVLLTTIGLQAAGPVYLSPTNAAPFVQLTWDPLPDQTVTNIFIYQGVASGLYTNKVNVGNGTSATMLLPTRGVQYFFAATAFSSSGLEGAFSGEVTWRPALPPLSPGLKPPVTLAIQTKSASATQWVDAGMDWSVEPAISDQVYRIKIAWTQPQLSPQAKAIAALHSVMTR